MKARKKIVGGIGLAVVIATSFCACGTAQRPVSTGIQTSIAETLSPEQQRKYDQFFLDAILEREKGHSDAAFDLLRHCLDINPNASEAHYSHNTTTPSMPTHSHWPISSGQQS